MTKAPYTTRETKAQFMKWLSANYGYITLSLSPEKTCGLQASAHPLDNSRILSEKFYKETKIKIPKLTIYRWMTKLNADLTIDNEKIASNYISNEIREVISNGKVSV